VSRAALLPLLAALALGCEASPAAAPPVDAGLTDVALDAPTLDAASDVTPTGPLSARIEGAGFVYQGEETCLTVAHNGGPDARFSWILEPDGVRASTGRACRRWSDLGAFRAFVTVESRGMRVEVSAPLRVVARPTTPRPTASSTIAYDPVRREVWVVNPDADSVTVLSDEPTTRLAEVPVCDHPRTLAVSGPTVAVACQDDGALWLLDAAGRSRRVAVALGAGARPYGVAADPRGGRFFVTLQDAGRLVVVDATTGSVTGSVDVGFDAPRDHRQRGGHGPRRALARRRRRSPRGAGRCERPELAAAGRRRPPPGQEDLDSDTDNSGVPSFLGALAFAPAGRDAVVPALKANNVTGMFRTREMLTSQTTARAVLSVVSPGPQAPRPPRPRATPSTTSTTPPRWRSPRRATGSTSRSRAPRSSSRSTPRASTSRAPSRSVGGAPEGLALSPDGGRLFVQGFTTRTVRVYDVRDLSRAPDALAEVSPSPPSRFPRRSPSASGSSTRAATRA
jgi:DNA-binding beta-propeller fold protein YncE